MGRQKRNTDKVKLLEEELSNCLICLLKFTLLLVLISSLVFRPWGGLKVPRRYINLSSVSFNL